MTESVGTQEAASAAGDAANVQRLKERKTSWHCKFASRHYCCELVRRMCQSSSGCGRERCYSKPLHRDIRISTPYGVARNQRSSYSSQCQTTGSSKKLPRTIKELCISMKELEMMKRTSQPRAGMRPALPKGGSLCTTCPV